MAHLGKQPVDAHIIWIFFHKGCKVTLKYSPLIIAIYTPSLAIIYSPNNAITVFTVLLFPTALIDH